MRGLIKALAAALVLGLLLSAAAGIYLNNWLHAPLPLEGQTYNLMVERGSALRGVTRRLAGDGVLAHPRVLELYARVQGQADRIKAGEYAVQPGTTPLGLLDQLIEGRVRMYSFTIVEGWNVRDMLAALARHRAVEHTLGEDAFDKLPALLDLGYEHPEGLFFPETYRFPRGTTDVDLLRQAHGLMREKLAAAWEQRAESLPYDTDYEALILASIIEKETALDIERGKIAGVFARRLSRGMKLQTDPTVIYGIGPSFNGNLTRRDLVSDTPYNTYVRRGLPPTPIALPGEGSLLAAVRPEKTRALYFVATGLPDGSHYFAATLKEHNEAVDRYLTRLRERMR